MRYDRTGLARRKDLTTFPLVILISIPFALSLIAVSRWAPDYLLEWAHCPLREGIGFPCPTCGSTLAVTRLAEGNWLDAFAANPLLVMAVVIYLMIALLTIVVTIKTNWYGRVVISTGEKTAAKWLATVIVIANWVWIYNRSL